MEAIINDVTKIIMDQYRKAGKEEELGDILDGKRTITILGKEYRVTTGYSAGMINK